jgi:hypothetical protein
MENLAKRISTHTTLFTPKLTLCFSSYHRNFTRNLKLVILLLFLFNYACHPAASLVFDPGFVFVFHRHFHLSFSLTSFAAFYFMDELGTVLLNTQAFLC